MEVQVVQAIAGRVADSDEPTADVRRPLLPRRADAKLVGDLQVRVQEAVPAGRYAGGVHLNVDVSGRLRERCGQSKKCTGLLWADHGVSLEIAQCEAQSPCEIVGR